MTMQYDVRSAQAAATGVMISGPNRLKGYQIAGGGTAGNVVFRDGGAAGEVKLNVRITTDAGVVSMLIPGEGIRFMNDIHVTLPTSAQTTIFYG